MEDDLTALRYYVARLEDDLAIADNDLESLRRYSSRQALDIVTLGQEVGRLREALEKISALRPKPIGDSGFQQGPRLLLDQCQKIARAALAGEKKDEQPQD